MAGEITVGGNILASHTGVEGAGSLTLGNTVAPASSYTFRNKIINGNFDIWQRGTSFTGGSEYTADRFRISLTASPTHTTSRQSFSIGQTEVPNNPTYFLRTNVTTTNNSADLVALTQKVESVKTLAGKTATLSFWAKADANKNIATEVVQDFGGGGTQSSAVEGIGATIHSLTTSWQKFTTTVFIPSISGKTLGANVNDCLRIHFWFDAGSTYDSRTNSLGNQSGTFDIAQVQLEEGPVATPFEQRPLSVELSLCQRYYEKSERSVYVGFVGPLNSGGWALRPAVTFSTPKRATPTITYPSVYDVWTTFTINAGKDGFTVELGHSGTADPRPWFTWTADAEL